MPLGRKQRPRGDSARRGEGRWRREASARALQAPRGEDRGESSRRETEPSARPETWGVSAPRHPICEAGLLHLCGQPQAPGVGGLPWSHRGERRWAALYFAGHTPAWDRGPTKCPPHRQMDGTPL